MNTTENNNPPASPRTQGRLRALFSRLRVRLLVLVLIAILPALGLVLYAAFHQRRAAIEEAKQEALRVARLAAIGQKQHVEAIRQLLLTITHLRQVRRGNEAATQTLFTNLLQVHQAYANIGAVDREGYIFASAIPLTNRTYVGDRSYFQRATNTLKFAVGEYQVGRITGKATINMAMPVRDWPNRELIGVVFAALDLSWLNNLIARADLPDGSTLAVIDRKGTIMIRYPDPEKKFTGKSVSDFPGLDRVLLSTQEATGQARGIDGVLRLYAYTPLSRTEGLPDAWVVVGIPKTTALNTANLLLMQNLIFLGLVSMLALAAAWYGGDFFILRRIRTLLQATQRISDGDLTSRTGVKSGTGELNDLAHAFDMMAESLEQRVIERRRAEAELKALNEDLEQRVIRRTLELERSNQELEQFASVASHDLQEPLRMVASYVQLVRDRWKGKLDPESEEFFAFALDGAERMQRLILDLLTYSRVGSQSKPFIPIDCEIVLERVLSNLKVSIEERGAQITHGPLPEVQGDIVQLTQLFQNLIGNALKFQKDKAPAVHVQAEKKKGEWQFSIRDNGIGILKKDFDRIFVIFQRLHARDQYPGTGIGLSICKKIVERHGGRIWLESEPGRGTTFYFTLPAAA